MSRLRILGNGLKVSAVGLGCMGFTHAYGRPTDEVASLDDKLEHMDMSGVFGGSPVKKDKEG